VPARVNATRDNLNHGVSLKPLINTIIDSKIPDAVSKAVRGLGSDAFFGVLKATRETDTNVQSPNTYKRYAP